MSNYSVDGNRTVRDGSGREVGKVDNSGQVSESWHDRGKIENDRYTDEFGVDRGWVTKSSRTSDSKSGDGLGIILIFLVIGIYYLIYLGIKWLFVEGKKSTAHSSRSWGIASLLIPPFFILALNKGYKALGELKNCDEPGNQIKIAKIGIGFGCVGMGLSIIMVIGLIIYLFDLLINFI
jgi:hypothetical protein